MDKEYSKPFLGEMQDVPVDPEERKRALLPYRMMARMLVNSMDRSFAMAEVSRMDEAERAAGEEAFAGILYAYSVNASPWFALGMFSLCVGMPRVGEYMDKKLKERKRAQANAVEREINPEARLSYNVKVPV